MAFKERFKDKTQIVGKNGENAGLVQHHEAPRPVKKKQPKQEGDSPAGNSAPAAAPAGKQPSKAMMNANRASVPMSGPGGQPPQQQQHQQQPIAGRRSVSPSKKQVQIATPQTGMGMTPTATPPLGGMPGAGAPLGAMPGAPGHAPAKQPPGKKLAPMPGHHAPSAMGGGPAMTLQAMGGLPGAGAPPPMGVGLGGKKPMGGMGGGMGGGGMMGPGGVPPGAMLGGMDGAMAGKYNYAAAGAGSPSSAKRASSRDKKAELEKRPAFGRLQNANPDPNKPKPRPSTEPIKEPKNYKPYSVEEYKRLKEAPILKKGGLGLGPSDTDEQRFAREMKRRANEFANASNRVNMAVLAAEGAVNTVPETPPLPKEIQEKNERRLKAKEFAKNVPKPKVKPQEDDSMMSPSGLQQPRGGKLPHRASQVLAGGDPGYANTSTEAMGTGMEPNQEMLMEMEEKHRRDQEMIEAIKKQLKM